MSATKTTPGPWRWEYSQGLRKRLTSDGSDVFTAALTDSLGDSYVDIDEPDANLIAAAPELLAALECLFSNPYISLGDLVYHIRERELQGWDGPAVTAWGNAVTAAKAAIAKAKGESA